MDPELIAYLDAHFGKTSQQILEVQQQVMALREETSQRFEQVESTCRHTLVLVEGLRHELHIVAEGYLGVSERLQVQIEKTELLASKVHGWIEPYFRELDIRVKSVESRVDRQNMDVTTAVRKILNRPPIDQQ